ncbi:tryptophan synthase subunit alpha [Candidatus Rariloculus sp.]|uniref:tryptophan synthase subunit alpha n=1 Tax=Candidatus Rariloculus sp. TaxID=3101265 RepID=UPI003D0D48D3
MLPRDQIRDALTRDDGPAIVAYLTAGYPDPERFLAALEDVARTADAIEIGVPFSDPMADGVTIQRSSERAIKHGVSLKWIFDALARRELELASPVLLMSYLNPLLAFGYEALAGRAAECGVSGFVVPDLPYEESGPLHAALRQRGLALVQMVTPVTPPERLEALCAASEGFVYAVTRTGTTGRAVALPAEATAYLARVKAASELPVCAGFGVREQAQVEAIAQHADGVVVGTALVEVLERGEDAAEFVRSLRPAG